jgi:hypothetical protein
VRQNDCNIYAYLAGHGSGMNRLASGEGCPALQRETLAADGSVL